jgi:hypothetical protein
LVVVKGSNEERGEKEEGDGRSKVGGLFGELPQQSISHDRSTVIMGHGTCDCSSFFLVQLIM